MNKFLINYIATHEAMEKMMSTPPEKKQEEMKPWLDWQDNCGEAMVDLGGPIGSVQEVSSSGVTPVHNHVMGYSILQGNDFEEVNKLLSSNPFLEQGDGCKIEVCEIMDMH